MSVNLLCADIPYADIAFFVIIALGLILGIIRGFAKSFKGFFLTIAIMLAALLLIAPTFDKVRNLDVFVNMDNSISAKFESGNVIFSTPINVRVDAETGEKSYWVSVTTDEGTSEQPLESSMGNDLTSSLKGKFAVWLAKTFITDDGQTIGGGVKISAHGRRGQSFVDGGDFAVQIVQQTLAGVTDPICKPADADVLHVEAMRLVLGHPLPALIDSYVLSNIVV